MNARSILRTPGVACLALLMMACSPPASEPRPSDAAMSAEPGSPSPAMSPLAASPTPAAASPPTSPDAAVGPNGWREAASFEGIHIGGLVHGPQGYVAVGGEILDGPDRTSILRGRVLVSRDGSNWELQAPSDVFAGASLSHLVVASDGSYLAFGQIEGATRHTEVPFAAWESRDGRSWRRAELGLPDGLTFYQIAAGARGYLLAGYRDRAELWFSVDGRRWEPVELPRTSGHIDKIAGGAEGFVVTGASRDSSGLYVLASSDGRTWIEGEARPDLGVAWIAPVHGDWVLIGSVHQLGVPAWFSPNGLDWEQVAVLGNADAVDVTGLLSTNDRVYAGLGGGGHPVAVVPVGVWSSDDGRLWEPIEMLSDAYISGAATSGDTVVIAASLWSGSSTVHVTFFLQSTGR